MVHRVAPGHDVGPAGSRVLDVRAAVQQTVLYADLFDYPLRAPEIHRFLIDIPADFPTVVAALFDERDRGVLDHAGGWFFLRGRGDLVETRRRRAGVAAGKWRQARRCGDILAGLPFVRFVGVTGSLAMDNAEAHEDIDYFIVTARGRLWLTRGMAVLLTRLAQVWGITLCPNYLVTEANLEVAQHDLFVAHELAQMVPLGGAPIYRELLQRNTWAVPYLPNAFPYPASPSVKESGTGFRWMEEPLSGFFGQRIEDWERERKVRKLQQRALQEGGSVAFTRDECRGHFGDRSQQVMAAYRERLHRFGVPLPAGLPASDA